VISPPTFPPFDPGTALPYGDTGSGGDIPIALLVLFALGVVGVELVAFAIRRELRIRKRAPASDSGR
jgi:hypothetical protein